MADSPRSKNPWTTLTWTLIAVASVAWWVIEGWRSPGRGVLLTGLSLASFMVGCLVGFLFTSYGEETATVGKVRDWLIGGITGLAIAKFANLKGVLLYFAPSKSDQEFALALSAAVVYVSLGFFFMFFQRELILNVILAESRAARGKIDGTHQAGLVVKSFLVKLPASLLSGVDSVDDVARVNKDEADRLRALLYSDDVTNFLKQTSDALDQGTSLDWDVISKVAYINYYRTYFEDADKNSQAKRAIEWISRALVLNPLHADLRIKYADMYSIIGEYETAVGVLEPMVTDPDAPLVVRQWLGYFLLYIPGRLAESIRYSQEYRKLLGEDSDALFNIACAYAQAFCERGWEQLGVKSAEECRATALQYLRDALEKEPEYADVVRTRWTAKGESFECLAADKDFLELVQPGK